MALKTVSLFSRNPEAQRALEAFERAVSDELQQLKLEKQSTHEPMATLTRSGPAKAGAFVPCDTKGGAITVLLPKPTPENARKVTVVKNTGGSANTIKVEAVDGLIDRVQSITMTGVYEAKRFYCDGQGYWTV